MERANSEGVYNSLSEALNSPRKYSLLVVVGSVFMMLMRLGETLSSVQSLRHIVYEFSIYADSSAVKIMQMKGKKVNFQRIYVVVR